MLVTLVLKAKYLHLEVLFITVVLPVKPFQHLNAQCHLIVIGNAKEFY